MAIDQLDYGDYHKFKVSLGIACIIAALVIPWVFLREPFDLMIEPGQLAKLDKSAQELIAYRQYVAQLLIWTVPFLSGVLFIFGVVFVSYGLHQWKKIQHWYDEEQRLKVHKLEREITQMTPVEVREKAEAEVAEEESAETVEGQGVSLQPMISVSERKAVGHYLEIEKRLSYRIEQCLNREYNVLPKRRLEKAEYDLILAAHSQTTFDRVIEIKYATKNFGRHWVMDNVKKTILATELYAKGTNRKAVPAILFVSPETLLNRKNLDDYKSQAEKESSRLGSELAIEFIPEENLDQLTCEQVQSMLTPRSLS